MGFGVGLVGGTRLNDGSGAVVGLEVGADVGLEVGVDKGGHSGTHLKKPS